MNKNMKMMGWGILAALIVPVAAEAADMPVKARPAPPPPPYSWTGFYIGGDIGGVWANGSITDNRFGLSANTGHSGFLGGGEIGYNFQASNLVLGIEGNFDWTSLITTGTEVVIPTVGAFQASASTDWVTTLAGRLGVAADRALLYVKGGGGWVRNTATVTNLTTAVSASASNTNSGWLVGAGFEWGIDPNWSLKLEYDYLGLRSWTFGSTVFPGNTFTASRNIQEVKLGFNYRFGGLAAPVMSKY
jgi:opacity protein-like surface antigen